MNHTIITTTVAAIAALALNSCATTEATSTTAAPHATGASQERRGVERYPFDTCIVTDNELGSMGDPITLVHEGREVKFCCAPCVRKFNANPEKYLARLDEWIADAAM